MKITICYKRRLSGAKVITKQVLGLVILFAACFLACEKFTGYDYESESIGTHSTIHGRIQNIFDRTSVENAEISIGVLKTTTDDAGNYSVDYIIGVDEERNKPLDFILRAENYYPLDTSIVIFPPDMQFNLQLVYAAPIIEKAWTGIVPVIVPISGETFIFPVTQIMVTDYQGIATLDSIITTFYYAQMGAVEFRKFPMIMRQDSILTETTAYYEAIGPSNIGGDFLFYDRSMDIYISDNEKYFDLKTLNDTYIFVDQPLFSIKVDP